LNRRRLITLVTLALAGACSDSIHLGEEAPAWSADFETGNTTQWTLDGNGQQLSSSGGKLVLVGNPVHGGRWAMQTSISPTNNRPSFARLTRARVPQDAYFSLWAYIPARYTIDIYWNLFEFQGRTDPANPDSWSAMWSLNLHHESPGAGAGGDMLWYVYDRMRQRGLKPSTPMAAPVGSWFEIRAFVHQATDNTGRISFWIDGSPLVQAVDISTVPSPGMLWSIGSASSGISKAPAEVFFDDAAIVLPP